MSSMLHCDVGRGGSGPHLLIRLITKYLGTRHGEGDTVGASHLCLAFDEWLFMKIAQPLKVLRIFKIP